MKCAKLPVLVLVTLCFNADRRLAINVSAAEDNFLNAAVSANTLSPPFQQAAGRSEKAIIAQEQLARLNVPYTEDAFVSSADQGAIRAIALFLDSGLSPNASNQDGFTAL